MEIIEANDSFLKLRGNSRDEIIGSKCHQVYAQLNHRCEDVDLICPLESVVRDKQHIRQVRTRKGKNGDLRHFEVNVYPIWEKSGKIAKFVHISRDITQRLKEEEEMTRRLERMVEERTQQLHETHAKLLHQDKMASLGKLSASVVHEINNPIAGILNLVMLIRRIIDEDHLQEKDLPLFQKYLSLMETETRRISRIVSNLLAFSRPKKAEVSLLDINQLVEKTLILNANLLKVNRVKVLKRLAPDLPAILGSEDQIQQVFMNLVSNAVEAMESQSGGTLEIETDHSVEEDRIVINFKDTGPGIPKEDFSQLFEPFFTTKTNGKGVGLGLSVAYGIVKEHGGYIFVESEGSGGTTFRVTLPHSAAELPLQGGIDGGHENTNRR
jgi:PAS domain S-box-containing protein